MNEKLKIWQPGKPWKRAEREWDEGAHAMRQETPLKTLSTLPKMPGIAETGLKWKSLKYLVTHDHKGLIRRFFVKHPFKYTWRLIASLLRKNSFIREGDFFFYRLKDMEEFKQRSQETSALLVIGFSYCHKPFECPSGRFTDACQHAPDHPVCRQCFIGKAVNALPPQKAIPLFIPTVHYIGEKMFELAQIHSKREILFLITACEMTLKMFGDWGNMLALRGIGVRLDGRICNTMKAFEISEEGIKPGLTVVLPETERRILELIRQLWPANEHGGTV